MKYLANLWFAITLALSGCSFDITDVQSIDIETYPEIEKNVKLAEDLIYYDPRYIAFKVPSFDEATAQGIKLGYHVRSSDGKPSYRITYSMKVAAVAKNIDSLKSDFETAIPKLAALHASKAETFNEISPKGQAWINSLFNSSAEDILSSSSSLFREHLTTEELTVIIKNMSTEYGMPSSKTFLRAQFYEAFSGIPESVSLFYSQTYESGKRTSIRVSFQQEDGQWVVMGFRVAPRA